MSIEVGLGFGTALGCDEGTAVKVDVRDEVLVIGDGDVTAVPDGVAGVTGDDAV